MSALNFTFVIPTHNSSGFISLLLDSIPYRDDIQVVIVDDYSDDFERLQDIVSKSRLYDRVLLLRNKGVASAGAARNIGLDEAKGRWIIFADSDDVFTEGLGKVLDYYRDSTADIVLFPATEDSKSSRTDYIKYCFNQYQKGDIDEVGLSYRLTTVWSKLYRREAIEELRYREVVVANDVLYAMKAAFATRSACVVDTTRYIYLLSTRDGSITATKRVHPMRLAVRIRERVLADLWLACRSLGEDRSLPSTGRLHSIARKVFLRKSH